MPLYQWQSNGIFQIVQHKPCNDPNKAGGQLFYLLFIAHFYSHLASGLCWFWTLGTHMSLGSLQMSWWDFKESKQLLNSYLLLRSQLNTDHQVWGRKQAGHPPPHPSSCTYRSQIYMTIQKNGRAMFTFLFTYLVIDWLAYFLSWSVGIHTFLSRQGTLDRSICSFSPYE